MSDITVQKPAALPALTAKRVIEQPYWIGASREINRSMRLSVLIGFMIILTFFGGFGVWAYFAPLNGAAMASGFVGVSTKRKTIQHLEGGIIKEILVKEGDIVKPGQPMLVLDGTQSQANLDIVKSRYATTKALEVRLIAERDGKSSVDYPADLLEASKADKDLAAIIQGQTQLFETRRSTLQGQTAVLQQRIAQSDEIIRGAQEQIRAKQVQNRLLDEEISTVLKLLDSGNATKPRLLALQRNRAAIDSDIAELTSVIARTKQNINETQLQIINLQRDRQNDVATNLRQTQDKILDLQEQLRSSQDVAKRITITAPEEGKVMSLKFVTTGGVIRPGESILDLVPTEDKMVINAQLPPQEISAVHVGQAALVRLLAYKSRTTPSLNGVVTYLSADRLIDPKNGQGYYDLSVEVDLSELEKFPNIKLYPGSPAQVMIATGERTAMDYLLSPFTQSLNRAFREQ